MNETKNKANNGNEPDGIVMLVAHHHLQDELAHDTDERDPAPHQKIDAVVADIFFGPVDHGLDQLEALLWRKIIFHTYMIALPRLAAGW